MNNEEILTLVKKLVIDGKKIGDICAESGVSRGTIQSLLRGIPRVIQESGYGKKVPRI
ncbi:MAG: hypothetical protein JSR76_02350 [Verrucomicrobia bacterium]|nr:hypothetical protein [Verrucomicrobiota bacterium]